MSFSKTKATGTTKASKTIKPSKSLKGQTAESIEK